MSARTRRQKAALNVPTDDSEDLSTHNGHLETSSSPSKTTKRAASKKRSRSAAREEEENDENIFLFAPNLIGTSPVVFLSRGLPPLMNTFTFENRWRTVSIAN